MFGYSSSNFSLISRITLITLFLFVSLDAVSAEFNFSQSTPVGSWALREDNNTNHKGKQILTESKLSIVGSDQVDGSTHYWLEIASQDYKLKKEKRKKKGQLSVLKVLVDAEAFSDSPANVIQNLSKYAKTIILQTGDSDPMLIEQGGLLGESMMKGLGIEVEFSYSQGGKKTVTVPAGKFSCTVFNGEGSTETKVLIKTMKIESKTEGCFSNKVPFGLVYANTQSTVNGKPDTNEVKLVKFGASGAESAITKEPVEGPKMPKLF